MVGDVVTVVVVVGEVVSVLVTVVVVVGVVVGVVILHSAKMLTGSSRKASDMAFIVATILEHTEASPPTTKFLMNDDTVNGSPAGPEYSVTAYDKAAAALECVLLPSIGYVIALTAVVTPSTFTFLTSHPKESST